MKRQSGILMHISSLYGDYSVGNFGKNAKEFVDFLVDNGFSVWQVLPFTVTDEYNSPYKSFSAFGGNPYFIDPEKLYNDGLISAEDLKNCKQKTPYSCEFERLGTERMNLLRKAYKNSKNQDAVREFIESHPRIEAFCRFMTLREQNGLKTWQEWESEEITDYELLGTWQFIQYEFFTQWAEIKAYANSKGVSIIGDIPIYVSDDSCDVWENRHLFDVDEKGYPTMVAGVPPDYFAKDGQ
ncbi:MAG: 4-alpha-glucanotransferase, partial [Clostridia bacterium]|nr:4-alpha-glucanotransferase [Clostridia bacterium]